MAEKFLKDTYGQSDPEGTMRHYDKWAATYDAEIAENGYATPGRCAAALARHLDDHDAPLLDFGCGTGLSGVALGLQGFQVIDGLDPSAEMLAHAKDRDVYRRLTHIPPGADVPGKQGDYAAITAIGVIGVGAAPPTVMQQIMTALSPGGLFVFSLNDHALADPDCCLARDALITSGQAEELEQTYGDHLPGIDLKSTVYVYVKL
ncbi:class I SAM-dependent methyltransferase [Rhodobacteraceae bacterium D3-12]|nr:class I SAM-dependent methyltransferase [Rhodobacteraceae bacterium D3-12]